MILDITPLKWIALAEDQDVAPGLPFSQGSKVDLFCLSHLLFHTRIPPDSSESTWGTFKCPCSPVSVPVAPSPASFLCKDPHEPLQKSLDHIILFQSSTTVVLCYHRQSYVYQSWKLATDHLWGAASIWYPHIPNIKTVWSENPFHEQDGKQKEIFTNVQIYFVLFSMSSFEELMDEIVPNIFK